MSVVTKLSADCTAAVHTHTVSKHIETSLIDRNYRLVIMLMLNKIIVRRKRIVEDYGWKRRAIALDIDYKRNLNLCIMIS